MQVLPSPIPQSFKITNQYVWLPDLYTLPAQISYDVICGSEADEFLPCFSFTKAEWASSECDALCWYASPHRDDFTFRTKLFREFPTIKRLSPSYRPTVGIKFHMECKITETSATYSINGKDYATATYQKGTVPAQGYFGFAKHNIQNITVENVNVAGTDTQQSVNYRTVNHLDTLKIASSYQTVIEMIGKITTDGNLNEKYEYLYSDLFVVFNRIYNNGAGLDSSINNALRDEINHDFDRMHYHISVAEGLALGIITAPGVGPEVDHATDWSNKAQSNIQKLNDNASQIIIDDETRRYVEGLQKATNDKALNVDQLIKSLFWTIIVNLNKSIVTKEDFEGKVAEIHLDLLKLKDAKWQGLFDLDGLKINLDKPGENDDFGKVHTTLGIVGESVGVLGLGVMVYNWKVSGVKPGRFFKAAFQKLTSSTPEEAVEMTATGEAIAVETVEISALEVFADVLGVIGLLLAVIGGIIEAVELDKELDKINSAKKDFNNNYNELSNNVESVVRASERIRKHS